MAPPAPDRRARRLGVRAWTLIGIIGALIIAAVVMMWPRPDAAPSVVRSAAGVQTSVPAPAPSPTPTGFPANTEVYDAGALPAANVFAILPQLPVDPTPEAPFAGFTARAIADIVPVWADPRGDPVAALPREYRYGGTTVAVVEKQQNWVRVLLTGRQGVPSEGDPAQLTGWVRTADVELAPMDTTVEVSLSGRTIDIVRAGASDRIATDFGWGTDQTPTPIGRSFIHLTEVTSFDYTRGFPVVYLSLQSPVLDGFGGQDVAITAFHYHDDRAGAISNGCLRLDEAAITKLAELPAGTGVVIRP
ncbi:L,D-transpeptidase [Microbacterium abyssi]|uniref:L,D-transpeptidase n=1 Tax=Microbacterium abyssi TaxID=2782166 RepID=UPI0018889661|nr:L,D-transpeptidase [Microbacterium sp. A18JL241]